MNKISLYIVEDYLLTRVGLKHTLSTIDELEVIKDFANAEDCIEAMKTTQVDVILMDLGLPKMNGIEATSILRAHFPNTKVIVLTSHEKDEEVLAALAVGANAYCLKETDGDMLLNVIKTVNDGALWLTPQLAQVPFNHLPTPISKDFGNLYPKNELSTQLTEREKDVLKLLVQGKSNPEIASEIYISPHTAKAHVTNILIKMGVDDRVQAAVKAVQMKLV